MHENNVIEQVLANLKEIKKLEADNKKLQEFILRSENSEIFKKKIDDLLYLLQEKDNNLKKLEEKIKKDYSVIFFELNKKYESEKENNSKLLQRLANYNLYVNENKKLKLQLARIQFLMKKEYQKKLEYVEKDYSVYKEKHKTIIKEYEQDRLNIRKHLELEKQKNIEIADRNKKLSMLMNELQLQNVQLSEINKKLFLENKTIKSLRQEKAEDLDKKSMLLEEHAKKKVNALVKQFLEKEIEYRAMIDAKNNDIKRLVGELENFRMRYYNREKELKEKLKGLF